MKNKYLMLVSGGSWSLADSPQECANKIIDMGCRATSLVCCLRRYFGTDEEINSIEVCAGGDWIEYLPGIGCEVMHQTSTKEKKVLANYL